MVQIYFVVNGKVCCQMNIMLLLQCIHLPAESVSRLWKQLSLTNMNINMIRNHFLSTTWTYISFLVLSWICASFCCWLSVVRGLLLEDCCLFVIPEENKADFVINRKQRKHYYVLLSFCILSLWSWSFICGSLVKCSVRTKFVQTLVTLQTSHVKLLIVF